MNTPVDRSILKLTTVLAPLRLALLLAAVGILLLGCGGLQPTPAPSAMTANNTAPEPTAAPEPNATGTATPTATSAAGAVAAAACNAIATPSVLVAWDTDDANAIYDWQRFSWIADRFANDAQSEGFTAATPAAFQSVGNVGQQFAQQMDQHTIGFYVGHGDPAGFSLEAGSGITVPLSISNLPALGQCDNVSQGQLRYLILSSCQTLAHGPNSNLNGSLYSRPGEWQYDSAGDTPDMRSIYARWGPALGNGLRMVCGASTDLTANKALGIWGLYGLPNKSVADAIVGSLSGQNDVAICLAKGGSDFADSPLMQDMNFKTESNDDDDDDVNDARYHLQYSKPFTYPYQPVHGMLDDTTQVEMGEQEKTFRAISSNFPDCLPVIAIDDPWRQTREVGAEQNTAPTPYSSEAEALKNGPGEGFYVTDALDGLESLGLENPGIDRDNLDNLYASGLYLMLATFPADPAQQNQEALRVAVKSVIVTFPQVFRLDKVEGIEALGRPEDLERLDGFFESMQGIYEGQPWAAPSDGEKPLMIRQDGYLEVQLNVDGTPMSGINAWHPMGGESNTGRALGAEKVINPHEAFLSSLWKLYFNNFSDKDPSVLNLLEDKYAKDGQQPYRLESWEWG